ncbi:MAG: carbon-nitrogen family hydrolase [Candidatus Heimdallarchaeota archaeon]|nr:carbon-nitrogen family hydrolase [Candidatus Heimdallarchaeota archaeon]
MSTHIILYQMDVVFGNSSMNFSKIEKFLNSLKKIELNSLLILPELFLTGYDRSEIEKTAFENEESMSLSKLISIANQYNIAIFGSIAEKFNDNYYNTAVFITKEGIKGNYQKIHLFGPMGEKSLFNSGSDIKTVIHQGITFGLSICYDLRFPLMYQKMMDEGAEIILVVAEWPIARVNHWTALLKARAIENQSFVIGLNRVGDDPDYTYGGHSAVISPYGDVVCEIANSAEGYAKCEIDLDLVKKFRSQFDVRQDRIP